jgi:hypothetical protein
LTPLAGIDNGDTVFLKSARPRSAAKLLTKDEARRIAGNVSKLPELLLGPKKCDIVPMPGLPLDTGKTHEAAGIYITYWQHGRRVAARGTRTTIVEHNSSRWSPLARR